MAKPAKVFRFMACPCCVGTGQIPEPTSAGEYYRSLRLYGSITQVQLAASMQFDGSFVSKLEAGRISWNNERETAYYEALVDRRPDLFDW